MRVKITPSGMLSFGDLPLWKGARSEQARAIPLPFNLIWDERGFLSQSLELDVNAKILSSYGEDSYEHLTQPPGESAWSNKLGDQRLEFLSRHCSLEGKSLLEIGAGSLYIGEQLINSSGVSDYVAIDPTLRGIKSETRNLEVIPEYYSSEVIEGRKFDTILAFHCLEHVMDPVDFLKSIRMSLGGSDSRLVLSVPNVSYDLTHGNLNPFIHEHISYFTESSAINVFEQAGFKTVALETQSNTISCVLEPADEKSCKDGRLECENLEVLAEKINSNILNIKDAFKADIEQGKKIAIHGINPGVTNLFYLMGVSDTSNIYLFDGDKSKVGKYLSFFQNPIIHSSDPKYREMDEVFVAVTAFFDEIKSDLFQFHDFSNDEIKRLCSI